MYVVFEKAADWQQRSFELRLIVPFSEQADRIGSVALGTPLVGSESEWGKGERCLEPQLQTTTQRAPFTRSAVDRNQMPGIDAVK